MVTGVEWNGKRIPCRLIVFDKDGTLIDFAATWVPLLRRRVDFLLKALGRDGELGASLLRSWGIDPISMRIDPRGPCPVSPRSEEIVIGTVADMMAGKRAGLALTIGILEGGITPREELEKAADAVLDSIRDLKFYSDRETGR